MTIRKVIPSCVVFSLLSLVACHKEAAPKSPMETALTESPGVQRFMPVQFDDGVALDTQTGRLCKTWNWNYLGEKQGTGLDALETCSHMLLIDGDVAEHLRQKRESH